MKTLPATWETDEPCPSCDADLVLVDTGTPVLRAECRACGHAETWNPRHGPWVGAW
jgi:hypothetical protein